ncbi:MAG: cytochrome, partial [Spirosoma sp.]|nr:cytochrome [Spirosoma sp.]
GRFLPGDSYISLPSSFAAFEQNQPFTISSWFKLAKPGMAATLLGRTTGPMDGQRGYQLDLLTDGRLKLTLNHVWPANAIDIESAGKVPVNAWFQVAMTYNGMGRANGLTLYLNGKPMRTRVIADNLQHSMVYGKDKSHWAQHSFYVGRMHDYFYKDFAVDELRIYDRCLDPLEMPRLAGAPDALAAAMQTPLAKRSPAQRTGLYTYYVTAQDSVYQTAYKEAMKLRGEQLMLYTNADQVMVMQERKQPRVTHLLKRGAYDAPGEVVQPAVIHSLEPMPDDMPRNRLGLARWLLMPDNPLFSRVMVNRIWQQYFGQGLAKNSDDFGNQGALPSHPELLDYLAVRFREGDVPAGSVSSTNRWNVKAIHKLIVMSATYRQSSTVSEAAREADLDNTFLTRGPSYRMSAEQVRDNALAASGLLTKRIGGPSVRPYQPAGIWEALATRNAVKYIQSQGDSLYRRSMYTIWKRSSPPPMMLNFDAAERHTCIVKRQKTSTPLQALVTLNDPQFVEAARVLAQRSLANGDRDTQLINKTFKSVISRLARPEELKLIQQLYTEELADFKKNPKRAQELLSVGEYPIDKKLNPTELAAWTVVTSTVMNFDEAVVKR